MRTGTTDCTVCNERFDYAIQYGPVPRYCSTPCRTQARRQGRREAYYRHRARGSQPCSRCGELSKPGQWICYRCNVGPDGGHRHCEWCGTSFLGRATRRYCSRPCASAAKSANTNPTCSLDWRTCRYCKRWFYPNGKMRPRRTYCSPRCAYLGTLDRGREAQDRRWEGVGVSFNEWADLRLAVFERDNWTCTSCGLTLDPYAKRGSVRAPECDHVVPVRHGGVTTMDNLAASCAPCNRRWSKSAA